MAFELPPLPFGRTDLEPHLSGQSIDFHYGKHHQTYVANLNALLKDAPLASKSLEEVVVEAWKSGNVSVFNNAAQVWNHTFFWQGLKKNGGGAPTGALAEAINTSFGSLDAFKAEFKQAGITQFGSGWAWLTLEGGVLKTSKTGNAETPLIHGQTPLFTADVWEHAYYLDFQNRRPDFLQTVLDHLINWDFVADNYAKAKK